MEEVAVFTFLRFQVSQKHVEVQIINVMVARGLNCAVNTSVTLTVEPPPPFLMLM